MDKYLDSKALRRNSLFHQLLQALIELASSGSDERAQEIKNEREHSQGGSIFIVTLTRS